MELPSSVTGPIDGVIEFIYSFGPILENTVILGEFVTSNKSKKIELSLENRTIYGVSNRPHYENSCFALDLQSLSF